MVCVICLLEIFVNNTHLVYIFLFAYGISEREDSSKVIFNETKDKIYLVI